MTKRRSLSKRKRWDVLSRDDFTCQYCGRSAPEVALEVDHIKPVSRGGTCKVWNLVTSCFDCNRGKSDCELPSGHPLLGLEQACKAVHEEAIDRCAALWSRLMDYEWTIDDSGREIIGRALSRYREDHVRVAIRTSIDRHVGWEDRLWAEPRAVRKSIRRIPAMCRREGRRA